MLRKWSKRIAWLVMLSVLAFLPSQIAHAPQAARPDEAAAAARVPSVPVMIAAVLTLAGIGALVAARGRLPRRS
jgi:hypothetical protein